MKNIKIEAGHVFVLFNELTEKWKAETNVRRLRDYLPDGYGELWTAEGLAPEHTHHDLIDASRKIAKQEGFTFNAYLSDDAVPITEFVEFVDKFNMAVIANDDKEIVFVAKSLPDALEKYISCDYEDMRTSYLAAQDCLPAGVTLSRVGGMVLNPGDRF